jgi:hypothetical protein
MAIAARKIQAPLVEHPHDLGHGAELQEHLEHKLQTLLNRQVGVLRYHAAWVAHQAGRQVEREFATLGLGE